MDFGFTSKMEEYYLQALAGKNAAAKATTAKSTSAARHGGVSFGDIISTKSAQGVSGQKSVNLINFNSALIVLDENGEVARWNLISGGGGLTGPTEAEQRQFEEDQKAKKLRRAKYARIIEECALKRKLQEMERNKAYYQESIKALPLSSVYQRRVRDAMNTVSHSLVSASSAGVMTSSITGANK